MTFVVWRVPGFRFGNTLFFGCLRERDGGVVELFAKKALDEGLEVFAGFGKREGLRGVGPFQLIAGSLGGDPDLADGGVGRDDEFAGAILEDDVHDAVVVFILEGAVALLGSDERLLEGFEGTVGFAAEGCFVDHEVSVRQRSVWGVSDLWFGFGAKKKAAR
jgi:hypothetical protein